jgi:predicted membrane protein
VVSTSNVSLEGGTGDRTVTPTRAAEIAPEYRLGAGNLELDLSSVDLSEHPVGTKVSTGIGTVRVIVPHDADVSVDARSGIGELNLFDQHDNGTSVQRTVVDLGPGGDGTIDLTLDLDVSIGQVEVDRAAA